MPVWYHGHIHEDDAPIFNFKNRGLKYGDGLFETIRKMDGKCPYLSLHLKRLRKGMKALGMDNINHFSTPTIKKQINRLTANYPNARIRLTVFRKAGGWYTPVQNEADYFIEYQPLSSGTYDWTEGLAVGICPTVQIPVTSLSGLKTTNALPYILAAQWRQTTLFDDCVLLNTNGNVAEASSSNLFLVNNKTVFTPDDHQGGVNGVMRAAVLQTCKSLKIKVVKTVLSPSDLEGMEEMFLTNAILGIRSIGRIGQFNFKSKEITKKIFSTINDALTT